MKTKVRIYFVVALLMLSLCGKPQKRVNLILSVDSKVAEGSFMNISFRVFSHGSTKEFKISYFPGSLYLPDQFDFENSLLLSDSIHLLFDYSIFCNQSLRVSSYQIDFKKSWLDNSYTVVNIFNTDIGKNRRKYLPLSSKTYAYDVFYPGGSAIAIRKKAKSYGCD